MPIVSALSSPRKPFVLLFAPEFTRRIQNPAFGIGLARDRRLPVGPSDLDRAFAAGPCPPDAPASSEIMAFERFATFSQEEHELSAKYGLPLIEARLALADYAAFREEQDDAERLEAMAREYYLNPYGFEEQELAEMGVLPERVQEVEVAPPAPRRPKATTRHQRSKAAAKAARIAPVEVEDDFAVPEAVDAIEWAMAISTELRSVATAEQLRSATMMLESDVEWQYQGQEIYPMGPTIAQLRARLTDLVPA